MDVNNVGSTFFNGRCTFSCLLDLKDLKSSVVCKHELFPYKKTAQVDFRFWEHQCSSQNLSNFRQQIIMCFHDRIEVQSVVEGPGSLYQA